MINFEQYKSLKFKTFCVQREFFHELWNNRNRDFEFNIMESTLSRKENYIYFNDLKIGRVDEISACWPYMQMRIKALIDGQQGRDNNYVYWNFYKE